MNFSNKYNFIIAKLALGDALDLFDLSNPKDNAAVSFAVKAYISGGREETMNRVIRRKLSEAAYDSNGMLKADYVLSDSEQKFMMGMGPFVESIDNNNNCIDIINQSEEDTYTP